MKTVLSIGHGLDLVIPTSSVAAVVKALSASIVVRQDYDSEDYQNPTFFIEKPPELKIAIIPDDRFKRRPVEASITSRAALSDGKS